eukprot:2676000-Prymnesium_polylepis.1
MLVSGSIGRFVRLVGPRSGRSVRICARAWGHTSGFTAILPAPGGAHLGLHRSRPVPQVGTSQ